MRSKVSGKLLSVGNPLKRLVMRNLGGDIVDNVKSIFPANDFSVAAGNAAKDIEVGIIIGYNKEGVLSVFGGGLLDGRQPTCKDWLWMIETFKQKMIAGDYHD